ncbi:MAG: hypothetical protein FWF81_00070 [Defluviitaleaceae bacterium]|nr:hypothetical protein [Defluviitaleaceae bacterium]
MDKGLDVKGLDVYELSRKMEKFVTAHFNDYKLGADESMFMEGHLFYYEEVQKMFPSKHQHLFTGDCKFLGMSGYITVNHAGDKADERIIMLLMDEQSERAYLLCLEETDEQGNENTVIIEDFLA